MMSFSLLCQKNFPKNTMETYGNWFVSLCLPWKREKTSNQCTDVCPPKKHPQEFAEQDGTVIGSAEDGRKDNLMTRS